VIALAVKDVDHGVTPVEALITGGGGDEEGALLAERLRPVLDVAADGQRLPGLDGPDSGAENTQADDQQHQRDRRRPAPDVRTETWINMHGLPR